MQELEHAKRRKERRSVTPEVEARPDQAQGIGVGDAVSDCYQSDGEASDISSRAEEIVQQVVDRR